MAWKPDDGFLSDLKKRPSGSFFKRRVLQRWDRGEIATHRMFMLLHREREGRHAPPAQQSPLYAPFALRGIRAHCGAMNDAQLLDRLRAKYRSQWDAHQIIADQNARLAKAGRQPSDEQLISEQRAAEAVALARSELTAAMRG